MARRTCHSTASACSGAASRPWCRLSAARGEGVARSDELSRSGIRQKAFMARRLISSGSTFEADIGYSRAVVQGDWVFVSGTTGFDYTNMTIAEDVETQAAQCLKNIESALVQAGASLADVVRVTYVVPEPSD